MPLRPVMREITSRTKNTKNRILAASIATPDKPNMPKALASKAITRKINAYRNMMTSCSTCERFNGQVACDIASPMTIPHA